MSHPLDEPKLKPLNISLQLIVDPDLQAGYWTQGGITLPARDPVRADDPLLQMALSSPYGRIETDNRQRTLAFLSRTVGDLLEAYKTKVCNPQTGEVQSPIQYCARFGDLIPPYQHGLYNMPVDYDFKPIDAFLTRYQGYYKLVGFLEPLAMLTVKQLVVHVEALIRAEDEALLRLDLEQLRVLYQGSIKLETAIKKRFQVVPQIFHDFEYDTKSKSLSKLIRIYGPHATLKLLLDAQILRDACS